MKIEWKTCLKIAVTVFGLYLCITYWIPLIGLLLKIIGAAAPLFAGFVIAYILNIVMSFYESHYFTKHTHKKLVSKTKRPVCMILAILSLCGALSLIVGLVIPELISCITFLIKEIPPAIEQLINSDFVKEKLPEDYMTQLANINWKEHIQNLAGVVATGIGGVADIVFKAITSTFSIIVSALISIIFAVYLLIDKDRLLSQTRRITKHYLPRKINVKLNYISKVANSCFRKFIVGQCTEAVILGILCTVGMLIFGFPYAGMVGALIGFTALIPIAGAYIGAAVGAVMILTESPVKALLFIVFIIVLQQFEGNIIYPKVVGNSIGLPALWVLAAVTIGGSLMGVLGMLIGVPITATVYKLLGHNLHRREKLSKAGSYAKAEDSNN